MVLSECCVSSVTLRNKNILKLKYVLGSENEQRNFFFFFNKLKPFIKLGESECRKDNAGGSMGLKTSEKPFQVGVVSQTFVYQIFKRIPLALNLFTLQTPSFTTYSLARERRTSLSQNKRKTEILPYGISIKYMPSEGI